MPQKFTCPLCHGEGHLDGVPIKDEDAPFRIAAYALLAFAILLGGAIINWTFTPRMPTPIEQCSQSCGQQRFKSFTEATREWL